MHPLRSLLWISLSVALAGCVSKSERNLDSYRAHVTEVTAALQAQGDADSLATAALLASSASVDRSQELMARAVDLAPGRADLAWLHIALCQPWSHCDTAPLEVRLRAIDPANGASWLGAVERAAASGNDPERAQAFAALAGAERVDFYWVPTLGFAVHAIDRTHRWPRSLAVVDVMGKLPAETIPHYEYLAKPCKGDALADAGQLAAWRGIARALMHGDTFLSEMIGISIAKRAWAEDPGELERLLKIERTEKYRMKAWAELSPRAAADDELANACMEGTGTLTSEQQVATDRLTRARLPLNPPTGTPLPSP